MTAGLRRSTSKKQEMAGLTADMIWVSCGKEIAMEKKETYFNVLMKTKEYKQKPGYTGFVFTGRENSTSYALGGENPWLKDSQFTFVDYIYVQDDPVGIILLRGQSKDEVEKEYRIYCGIEQSIDV